MRPAEKRRASLIAALRCPRGFTRSLVSFVRRLVAEVAT